MRIASRYLATVRRAMSMPASRSLSTMVSSDSTSSGALGVDQLLDAVAHRFGRMRFAAVGRRDRRGEEILQLEDAAAGRHVLVGGDARHRRFVHADGVGDGLEIERAQMLDAVGEEGVLLAHDLGRDLEDGLGALVERAHQPVRGLQAFGEIGLVARRSWRSWRPRRGSVWLTSTRGSVSELSSTSQPPSGPARTNTSGTIGCTRSSRRRGRASD